jgi:hypothetical protein
MPQERAEYKDATDLTVKTQLSLANVTAAVTAAESEFSASTVLLNSHQPFR